MPRDDFPKNVKHLLALRVGGVCSNPDCQRPTFGPSTDPERSVNIGVAAHITAASRGGPRYEPKLSSEERSAAENGIWLCQVCAKLVDADPTQFPKTLLKAWKGQAEAQAALSLSSAVLAPKADRDWTKRQWLPRDRPDIAVRLQGGRPLFGAIDVRGAKNTLPKLMIAALLTREDCLLRNVAHVDDVFTVMDMIRSLGGTVKPRDNDSITISTAGILEQNLEKLAGYQQASRVNVLFMAPLLHRFGRAVVPTQGGCNLGKRSISFHLEALAAMGARIEERPGWIAAEAPDGLCGAEIELPFPSVGATEQVLLAGSLAKGVTRLTNAAVDPEINDLIFALQEMGAGIGWSSPRELVIQGADSLDGFDYAAMTDRSEIGSWACAALATDGAIQIRNANLQDISAFGNVFCAAGGGVHEENGGLVFFREKELTQPVQIETGGHPVFRTDWQPPFLAALTTSEGTSTIHETVFEDRLAFVASIVQMGARVSLSKHCLGSVVCRFSGQKLHSAVISPSRPLTGAEVRISDIRGGFALLIAAFSANGQSILRRLQLLEKGYENVLRKCELLGANISAV